MKTKTSTSRKAQTAAAKSATKTTTDNTASELERKYQAGVTAEQRKERAARFKNHAEKTVAKMSGHDRVLLDAAAEAVGMDATALVAWQLTEERGLGELRDSEAEYNRWIDDKYESETTIRRNNHEREVARMTAAVYGLFGPAGLTDAEEVEVVRRFFRKGDASLSKAEGRAILCALEWEREVDANASTKGKASGPDTTRAEIEIAAAARIVGLSADEFITDALQSAIDVAKDLNGGELDLTADERAKLDAAKEN